MTFKQLKNKIKNEQKTLAQLISRGKYLRKPKNRTNLTIEDNIFISTYGYLNHIELRLRNEYRYKHIVYCNMFLNTPYEHIERSTKSNNKINSRILDKYRTEWESQIDEETIRNCA